jgi:hypothetical protein
MMTASFDTQAHRVNISYYRVGGVLLDKLRQSKYIHCLNTAAKFRSLL